MISRGTIKDLINLGRPRQWVKNSFIFGPCSALYLAAVKRRQELKHRGERGRKVLKTYSVTLVDRYAEMSAVGALLFYSLFVMTSRPEMVVTIPLVLFGLFRYWFAVEMKDGGESPADLLLSDRPLSMTVVAWVAASIWFLRPEKI